MAPRNQPGKCLARRNSRREGSIRIRGVPVSIFAKKRFQAAAGQDGACHRDAANPVPSICAEGRSPDSIEQRSECGKQEEWRGIKTVSTPAPAGICQTGSSHHREAECPPSRVNGVAAVTACDDQQPRRDPEQSQRQRPAQQIPFVMLPSHRRSSIRDGCFGTAWLATSTGWADQIP